MLFTGIDNLKRVSVDYSFTKKVWKLSDNPEGKKIAVIPSDRVLVKVEELPEGLKDERKLRKFLSLKYKNLLWDVKVDGNGYTLVLVRDFKPPAEYAALDAEIFSLARLSRVLKLPTLTVLDIGRRKTTFVEVENFKPKRWRVVLKGGDFVIEKVAETLKVERQEAEEILRTEGLKNRAVEEAFGEIFKNLPPFEGKVLLSGGVSKTLHLDERFETVRLPLDLPPERYSALGAALKFVYPDASPSFAPPPITKGELKILGYSAAVLLLSFFLSLQLMGSFETSFLKRVKAKEKELFERKFPELPPVPVREQLLTMQPSERRSVLELFGKLVKTLPLGVRIYKITYGGGTLKVKGEAPAGVIKNLKTTYLKDLGNGKYLFEVELR